MAVESKPALRSHEAADYWAGIAAGRLVLQQCAGCGRVRHYPRPVCAACYSMEATAFAASGQGAIHSWTICHRAFSPEFEALVPYVLALVDLDEGVRVNAPLKGVSANDIHVGLRVKVAFEDVAGKGCAGPVFYRAD